MNDRFQTEHRYVWLDLVRGLSALAVFAGHLRSLTFENYSPQSTTLFKSLFFYLTGFAHEAVIVFFVLSGFFISKAILDSIERSRWTAQGYAIDRLGKRCGSF